MVGDGALPWVEVGEASPAEWEAAFRRSIQEDKEGREAWNRLQTDCDEKTILDLLFRSVSNKTIVHWIREDAKDKRDAIEHIQQQLSVTALVVGIFVTYFSKDTDPHTSPAKRRSNKLSGALHRLPKRLRYLAEELEWFKQFKTFHQALLEPELVQLAIYVERATGRKYHAAVAALVRHARAPGLFGLGFEGDAVRKAVGRFRTTHRNIYRVLDDSVRKFLLQQPPRLRSLDSISSEALIALERSGRLAAKKPGTNRPRKTSSHLKAA